MQRQFKWSLAAMAIMTAACSDTDPMGPGPIMLANATTEVCTTISFDGPGHMTAVGDIDATELGLTLTTSGVAYIAQDGNPAQTATAPVVFFTQLADSVEDDDLQSTVPWGDCAACAGLGNIMVLPDIEQNPAAPGDPELPAGSPWVSVFYGDYRWGGQMRISGLTGGEYYIKSFKAVDQEDHEGAIRVYANGTGILGTATGLGDGSVETVMTTQTKFTDWVEFEHGTPGQDAINGSGGVDDVVICKTVDEPPPPPAMGRMTGGGVKAIADAGSLVDQPGTTTVTLGLTLHCDNKLSNNLEVNWGKGQASHQWHIKKESLENIICLRNENPPEPPASPIDYFEADAMGRLDGVDGSKLHFVFEDFGEPGKNDRITMTIYEPNSNTVALQINLKKISVGNLQMHYDQPHGQKP